MDIVHRDIKPADLHLGADDKLRILDLGVALNRGAIHETSDGATGTPSYMALERGERQPLAGRDPLMLWRSIALIALILNVILFYLLRVR